jgi:hypothetical protein
LAAVFGGHRQVVDVDLAARLFELVQLVGDQPADDLVALQRGDRDEAVAAEQPFGVSGCRPLRGVARRVFESRAEHRAQRVHQRRVAGQQAADHESPRRIDVDAVHGK